MRNQISSRNFDTGKIIVDRKIIIFGTGKRTCIPCNASVDYYRRVARKTRHFVVWNTSVEDLLRDKARRIWGCDPDHHNYNYQPVCHQHSQESVRNHFSFHFISITASHFYFVMSEGHFLLPVYCDEVEGRFLSNKL